MLRSGVQISRRETTNPSGFESPPTPVFIILKRPFYIGLIRFIRNRPMNIPHIETINPAIKNIFSVPLKTTEPAIPPNTKKNRKKPM